MTTVKIYRNKRNENKYIEVHNDGHYHNSVRQYMEWKYVRRGIVNSITRNYNGDCCLHRWRKEKLDELLEDYEEVNV